MIIDFRNNPAHAIGYSVFDATNGQKLDGVHAIFYADDQAGLLKVYRRDLGEGRRSYVRDPETGLPIVDELRLKIDIVPKR